MSKNTFDNLLILGRPAGGKSEFIDYCEKYPQEKRLTNFHINKFEELDDFFWIWELCKQDDIWEEAVGERLFSKYDGVNLGLTDGRVYSYCDVKLAHETDKFMKKDNYYENKTLFVEFSRGDKFTFENTLKRFSPDFLQKSACFYIKTSFEESFRRNNARYQEKLVDSKLAHKTPDFVMENFYKDNDWAKLTENKDYGYLTINNLNIPFVSMDNENETKDFNLLEERYKNALNTLFDLYTKK